jgi:hypothetical protein
MTGLSERLWMASAAAGEGTWVHGTFERAMAAPARAANELTRHGDRGAMLRDYLCVLEADHAGLREDTEAVLAQGAPRRRARPPPAPRARPTTLKPAAARHPGAGHGSTRRHVGLPQRTSTQSDPQR